MEKKLPEKNTAEVSENPGSVLGQVLLYTIVTAGVGALALFLVR